MEVAYTTPAFNSGVAVKETGVKPDTLRAWERRYGLPQPERTAGGHRLYSQRDIDVVKWLTARQEEGLTIGRAAELWQRLEAKGEDPLQMVSYQTHDQPVVTEMGDTLRDIREQWLAYCMQFDEAGAERVLVQAFAIYPVRMVCVEVLQKGLSQIGELWFQNEATPHQEHFASALIMQRLDALTAAAPAPSRIGRILLACPPGETHTISLIFLGLLLRYRGWEVKYLGGDVPKERFEATIDAVKPDLVVLAAQQLRTASSLFDLAQILQKKQVHLAFGGWIFNREPSLRERVPGHFLSDRLDEAVERIGQIMTFMPPMSSCVSVPEVYEKAAQMYRQKRPRIELDVLQTLIEHDVSYEHLFKANNRLYEDITAALNLGDLKFIDAELRWDMQLMRNYDIPASWSHQYFKTYYNSAKQYLNQEADLILNWLAETPTIYNGAKS